MKQVICDICGKSVLKSELSTKYRIQECVWSSVFFSPRWDELDVHSYCMAELMEIIRKKQKNEEG